MYILDMAGLRPERDFERERAERAEEALAEERVRRLDLKESLLRLKEQTP